QWVGQRQLPQVVVRLTELRGNDERAGAGPAEVVDARREAAQLLGLRPGDRQLPQVRVRAVVARLLAGLVRDRRVHDPLAVGGEGEAEVGRYREQRSLLPGFEVEPGECVAVSQAEGAEQALAVGREFQLADGVRPGGRDGPWQGDVAAVGKVNHLDGTSAEEGDPLAVRRPGRFGVEPLADGEQSHGAAGAWSGP